MKMYDSIVVGSGPAGCVIATRLASELGEKVCLIERGPRSLNPWLSVPLGYAVTLKSHTLVQFHQTEPSQALNGRSELWPRGRLVGGSASINAGVYVRPGVSDLREWDQSSGSNLCAHRGESFAHIEGRSDRSYSLHLFNPEDAHHPACRSFYDSCAALGLQENPRMYEPSNGFGPYWISSQNGRRINAVSGYLRKSTRPISILARHEANEILKINDGWLVNCSHRGSIKKLTAKRLFLSAGAIETPSLLVNSGIGPEKVLKRNGITVRIDSPHVGKNLKDHLCASVKLKSDHATLNQELRSISARVCAALRYLCFGDGFLSSSINQAGAFAPGLNSPIGFQLYFNPVSHSSSSVDGRVFFQPDEHPGATLSLSHCKPVSAGRLTFALAEGKVRPRIHQNFLGVAADVDEWEFAFKMLREALSHLGRYGFSVDSIDSSLLNGPAAFLEFIRNTGGTVYHPCGTCRMARTIADGVVNTNFEVFEAEGLYVCDASVFPDIPLANIQSSVFLLGEKLSDQLIEGET